MTRFEKTPKNRPKSKKAECDTYEEVAQYLLNHHREYFGLDRVEGKQKVKGRSGTDWAIDAKGMRLGDATFVLVECRRYTTKGQTQEQLGGLVYKIKDSGASGGFIVSHKPLQKGAARIAAFENVTVVRLDKDSTTTDYLMKVLNRFFVGVSDTLPPPSDVADVQVHVNRSVSETLPLSDGAKGEVNSGACTRGDHAECVNVQCVCPCHGGLPPK